MYIIKKFYALQLTLTPSKSHHFQGDQINGHQKAEAIRFRNVSPQQTPNRKKKTSKKGTYKRVLNEFPRPGVEIECRPPS